MAIRAAAESAAAELKKLRELLEPELQTVKQARLEAERAAQAEVAKVRREAQPEGRVALQR
ncbi:MAG: hypothetical protein U5P41_07385 [Gammaproteobacteria bacterium]|nr:hypothetical protein [Gammaproteobacteria bacterium]